MPDNVVEIVVRSKNETKTGFDEARRDAAQLGDDVGKAWGDAFEKRIVNLRTTIKASLDRAGADIGDHLGDAIGRRVAERIRVHVNRAGGGQPRDDRGRFVSGAASGGTERVKVDVDVDRQTFGTRMEGLGKEAGDKMSQGLGASLQSWFSGDFITLILKAIGGGALVAALAPAIGAAFAAAVLLALGGGVLGAGIAAAFRDEKVSSAAGELKDKLGKLFEEFGKPFRGPVLEVLERFAEFLNEPATIKTAKELGEAFAPLVSELGVAFVSALQNMLPGLKEAALAAKPLFEVLADHAPEIGEALGDFFKSIAESGPGAAQFLDDLLGVVEWLLRNGGRLISWLSRTYLSARRLFLGIIQLIKELWNEASDTFGRLTAAVRRPFNAMSAAARAAAAVVRGVVGTIRNLIGSISFGGIIGSARAAGAAVGNILGGMFAHGGVIGAAATGGVRSGLNWVGEHGPELVSLPPGATVHSNSDSMRMARGSEGGRGEMPPIIVQLVADGRVLAQTIVDPMRDQIQKLGGGSVQNFLGQPGRA